MGCPFRRSLVGGHPRLHDQGLCRAHDSGNRKLISRSPAPVIRGPADYASDSAELGKGSGRGRIAAFLMTASGRGATFCI
jgi:hypothetical protein